MHRGEDDSPPYIASFNGLYNASIASSASSSAASVWSDASSQSSDDSSVTSETTESYCMSQDVSAQRAIRPPTTCRLRISQLANVAPPEQRLNPRRTNVGTNAFVPAPPPLVRQCDRKVNFVDSLVDSSAQIVEAIWPLSSIACRTVTGNRGVLPLRTFIQETLRRSRTSYSTLQVALYYLILIKPHVPKHDFTMEQPEDAPASRALQCGRRMFLAALILASKYLQDRNYSARAWSKISGLNTLEINQNEIAFLIAVNWKLHIKDEVFQRWTDIVLKYTPSQPPSPGSSMSRLSQKHVDEVADWKAIVLALEPDLKNITRIAPKVSSEALIDRFSGRLTPPYEQMPSSPCSLGSNESTPTPKQYAPRVLEPCPSNAYPQPRAAPALGLLPTPRLTPQSSGFCTPAASAASRMLDRRGSMGYAMAQASAVSASQLNDRWPSLQFTSSPYSSYRRSSMATTSSLMSSPESMVSDNTSRNPSRSSSISSASSAISAPSSKLDVQARCRYAKRCNEKNAMRTLESMTLPELPTISFSPESYSGPVGKELGGLSLKTPQSQVRDSDLDAARTLQEIREGSQIRNQPRPSFKRARPLSTDLSLQENVQQMLRECHNTSWSSTNTAPSAGYPLHKKVCCTQGDGINASNILTSLPAYTGVGGRPGMWEGILN